jgi:hypothetical protein
MVVVSFVLLSEHGARLSIREWVQSFRNSMLQSVVLKVVLDRMDGERLWRKNGCADIRHDKLLVLLATDNLLG